MSPEFLINVFLPAIAFITGSCIGSFLNVVIYRLPEGMRVDKPTRSFCPHCKTQIPVWLNIPLVSWLMLRGKCRWCGAPIKFRYFLVEALTGFCFFAIWQLYFGKIDLLGIVALWILASMLISATFIDLDHMIIPDSITLGGLGVGLIFSIAVPSLHGKSDWLDGLIASAIGAAFGFSLLWCIVMLGKLAFGQIKHEFDEPVDFEISQPGGEEEAIIIQLGPDTQYEWQDVFYRSWDRMDMEVSEVSFDGKPQMVKESFRIRGDGFEVDGEKTDLETLKKVTGKTTRAVVPREAMGFGDVKFIAMIGAFQGWQGVLLTLMAGCCIGAVVGVIQKLVSKDNKIPFGPYLALGSFIFLFTGLSIWNWYMEMWRG